MADGQPLYLGVLDQLQRHGATGATALRGLAGFGASYRVRTAGVNAFAATPPVVIEWIDRADRVGQVLVHLDALLANALVIIEDVRVHRAVLRSAGPFGERAVGDAAMRDVLVAQPRLWAADAARQLLAREQALLPVLGDDERVLGVVSASELLGQALPVAVLRALPAAEREAALAGLPPHSVAEVMIAEPRLLHADALLSQATSALVEWGLDVLPVIESSGRFVGLFGIEQALRTAVAAAPRDSAIRDADPPAPVQLVMQVSVPIETLDAPAAQALAHLLRVPERFVVLVEGRQAVGIATDVSVAAGAQPAVRTAMLQMLQAPAQTHAAALTSLAGHTAHDLPHDAPLTITMRAPRDQAIRMLIDHNAERLVVVDDEGHMVGLVGRGGLLRALVQESAV